MAHKNWGHDMKTSCIYFKYLQVVYAAIFLVKLFFLSFDSAHSQHYNLLFFFFNLSICFVIVRYS